MASFMHKKYFNAMPAFQVVFKQFISNIDLISNELQGRGYLPVSI